jgi:hypothetical protein
MLAIIRRSGQSYTFGQTLGKSPEWQVVVQF